MSISNIYGGTSYLMASPDQILIAADTSQTQEKSDTEATIHAPKVGMTKRMGYSFIGIFGMINNSKIHEIINDAIEESQKFEEKIEAIIEAIMPTMQRFVHFAITRKSEPILYAKDGVMIKIFLGSFENGYPVTGVISFNLVLDSQEKVTIEYSSDIDHSQIQFKCIGQGGAFELFSPNIEFFKNYFPDLVDLLKGLGAIQAILTPEDACLPIDIISISAKG